MNAENDAKRLAELRSRPIYSGDTYDKMQELRFVLRLLDQERERVRLLSMELEDVWEGQHYEYCGSEFDPETLGEITRCKSVEEHIARKWKAREAIAAYNSEGLK